MVLAMAKRRIQRLAEHMGYRVVPLVRDANTLRNWLFDQPIRTVIDVGASTGTTVIEWLDGFPSAEVHAVEPLPTSFAALGRLRERFPDRVHAYNFALGRKSGKVEFRLHPQHDTSSSLLARTEYLARTQPLTRDEAVISVDMTTLDALFTDRSAELAPEILLKLDVQGVESDVIAGASKFLPQVKYFLTEISLAPVYVGQSDFNAVHSALTAAGFELKGFLEQYHLPDRSPVYADVLYANTALGSDGR